MKRKIYFTVIAVFLVVLAFSVIPFLVSAATESDADFKLTAADGTVSYHMANEFNVATGNPTIAASSGGTATLEMLRNVTTSMAFRIFGNVNFNGHNYTYTYNGSDYAFWTYNSTSDGELGSNVAEANMKKAKFTNLRLRCVCTTPSTSSTIAGGFKFYNSILELSDGNNIEAENVIILTPRDQGKVIISGGYYACGDGRNLFGLGGDITSGGKTYYSTVSAEITGGEFYLNSDAVAISFVGSTKNNCTLTISGGLFRTQRFNVVSVKNAQLNITGGEFYGDISVASTASANVTGGSFPKGIIVKGDGEINISSNVNIENPVVAELYIENSTAPYLRLTRSDLVYYFAQDSDTNVFGYDHSVYNKNSRVEILDNFYTYESLLSLQACAGKTVTVNGNGKTVYGSTSGEPILRAHGHLSGGTIIFNEFNLENSGASCFQFYNNITVDINNCLWFAVNHRVIFPTNSGTVNINEGTVLRGGQSAIYFNILIETCKSVINVKSGATLIGLNGDAIHFQPGSLNGTVNIESGSQARTKISGQKLITFSADSVKKDDDGNIMTDANGNTLYNVATNNTVNIYGGVLEGSIYNASSGNNTINIYAGTLYTTQTRDALNAINGVTLGSESDLIFSNPSLSYIVTIPELISFSPENSEELKITADLWSFGENSQLALSVSSANGFKLEYQNGSGVDPYSYTLMSSQMGVVREDCVAARFTAADDGKTVNIEASIDPGQQAAIFAGEYSDTLTFTISYTDTAEALFEMPKTSVEDVEWHGGFMGSDTLAQHWIVPSVYAYRYSDVFIVPKAGTTIQFTDYYGPVTNGAPYGNSTEAITPNSVFIFASNKFMYHNITQANSNTKDDPDDGYVWGYTPDYEYTGNPSADIGLSRRGDGSNCSATKAETGTKTIDGVTYNYVVWSYTTQRNYEAIRLCFRCESDVTSEKDMNGPEIIITEP